MKQINLDGSPLHFVQDDRLQFNVTEHRYKVEGLGELTPVSRVISSFFKPFDAEYWSLRKCGHDEEQAAQLRDKWNLKGAIASQTGTYLHKQIENFIHTKETPDMKCRTVYDGEFIHQEEDVDISKEWSFFRKFDRETEYHPFRTEWGIYDETSRIAGTIDLICSCEDGEYEIYDWKRSNKVDPGEANYWSSGINGLEHLYDTSYVHYCLQQNLYRYIVEKNYGLKIKRMNLVILHPDFEDYRIVPIPKLDREVDIILKAFPQTF